jgi:hypothetical protein
MPAKSAETKRAERAAPAAQCEHTQLGRFAVRPFVLVLLAVSLVGNVVGLYRLGAPSPPLPEEPAAQPSSALAPQPQPQPVTQRAGDIHAYLDALLARGLTLEETRPLVLARLMRETAPAAPRAAADEYWRSGYTAASLERLRERITAADRIRSLLVGLYGPQARDEAVFREVFAPLDARYAFLGSEQQLALQKYQLEQLLARATAPPTSVQQGAPQFAGGARNVEQRRVIEARLGRAAGLQYLYRFSPLAERLRAADIELSQAEFGTAFDALLQLESAGADSASFVHVRASLRDALGDARFTRLWAAGDPLFGLIAAAGRRYALSEQMVLAAYAIVNDAQDRLAAAATRFAALDPARAGDEMRSVQADTQQRLAGLVGEEAAQSLVRATTEFAVAMQRPSSTNLRE